MENVKNNITDWYFHIMNTVRGDSKKIKSKDSQKLSLPSFF